MTKPTVFMVLLLLTCAAFGASVTNLRCEYRVNPIGIDAERPRLSWVIESDRRGEVQIAYRLIVSTHKGEMANDKGTMWDSGKVQSNANIQIEYAGKPLHSNAQYFWKVKIWDKDGKVGAWSGPAWWSMGLLEESDWRAKWIGLDRAVGGDDPDTEYRRLSARMLRKEFAVKKPIVRATAYMCGLGLSELYINGRKIRNRVLSPGLTEYPKRSLYVTYDVGEYLKKGSNAVGVILGNGRYFSPRLTHMFDVRLPNPLYGLPKLLLQVEIDYEDGTQEVIVSDESWKVTSDGPITENNEYDGEKYDARKEKAGWSEAGFDDSGWLDAELVGRPSERIEAEKAEPIRVTGIIKPVKVTEPKPGMFIFDMGQNMVGWVRLKVEGPKGTAVKMRFAEALKDDGTLYMDNIRLAKVTDVYTLKGEGVEEWEPRFTYHGFRYVEMTGYPGKPDLTTIEGRVVHDDIEQRGTFECSNETINQIYRNAVWGIRGNYRSLPTDCPQRDERHAWLGDRATGSRGETYIFDIAALYSKWLGDIRDAQKPSGSLPDVCPAYWPLYKDVITWAGDNATWSGTYIILPGMLYDQYGDLRIVREHYPTMKKWVDYMTSNYLEDGILNRDTYGDWCVPPNDPNVIHTKDPNKITEKAYLGTTFFYYEHLLMTHYAKLLGKAEDAKHFAAQADMIKEAFQKRFFNPDTVTYSNDTATVNVLALAFGLVPQEYEQRVLENLVAKIEGQHSGHIPCGLVGMQFLMRTLTNHGRGDIAYRFATQRDYPSWGYMIEEGATTIWELWNGNTADPAMNSRNHVMLLGDFNIWLYECLAGIRPDLDRPGFRHIVIRPVLLGDLEYVRASHMSLFGMIHSEWKRAKDSFRLDVTIPCNTTAKIYVPTEDSASVTEGGRPAADAEGVKLLRKEGDVVVYEVGSGKYSFIAKPSK